MKSLGDKGSIVIVIALITASLLAGCFGEGDSDSDKADPKADLVAGWSGRSVSLIVANISREVDIQDVKYELLNGTNLAVVDSVAIEGRAFDIWDVDFRSQLDGSIITHVRYRDHDQDGMLSDGDEFLILTREECIWNDDHAPPGVCTGGMTFRLVYSNDKIITEHEVAYEPELVMVLSRESNNYIISMAGVSNSVIMYNIRYTLFNGTEIATANGTPIRGTLSDVYNVDLRNQTDGTIISHVSFRDANMDKHLSNGDAIFLMSTDNDEWNGTDAEPGVGAPGMIFRLTYIPTGEMIAQIDLV